VEREREEVDVEGLHVDGRRRHELSAIDEEVRAARAVTMHVAARPAEAAELSERVLGAKEVRRPGATDQLGLRVYQRGEVGEVELAFGRVEARQAALHSHPEARENLPTQPVPGDVVRVVLHHGGDDVVAVAELGHQHVHDRVVRLGGVPAGDEVLPARGVDEARHRVVGLLEALGHRLRGLRLAAMHVLVLRSEGVEELDELARRLGAGGVVGDDPARPRKREVLSDGVDVELLHGPPDLAGHQAALDTPTAGRWRARLFAHRGVKRG